MFVFIAFDLHVSGIKVKVQDRHNRNCVEKTCCRPSSEHEHGLDDVIGNDEWHI